MLERDRGEKVREAVVRRCERWEKELELDVAHHQDL